MVRSSLLLDLLIVGRVLLLLSLDPGTECRADCGEHVAMVDHSLRPVGVRVAKLHRIASSGLLVDLGVDVVLSASTCSTLKKLNGF